MTALLSMALHCVERYCVRHGLVDPQITAFLNNLWDLPLVDGPEAFQRWEGDHPNLVYVGLGDPYPKGFEHILREAKVDPIEFRRLLESTVEIVFSNFYGASNHEQTMRYARRAFHIARSHGIEPPDSSLFEVSRWVDRQGFGALLSLTERDRWRSLR